MSSSPTETTLVDVTMPQMGVSVAEGTVVEWKKQPGDWVERDEIIASISTDKIDTDVEAPASGRVQEVLVEVGETVDVGVVLARIATDAQAGRGARVRAESSADGTSEADVALEAPGDAGDCRRHRRGARRHRPARLAGARRSGPRRYSPVVMRIAAEHGIDLEQVEGTGRGGRVRKPDVLAYLENGGAAPRSRRCTSRARTSPSRAARPRADAGALRRAAGGSRSRACASRSARAWSTRSRRRRRARRSSRPT